MNLFEKIEESIKDGKNCSVNFNKKTIKIGRKTIFSEEKCDYEYDRSQKSIRDVLDKAEELYEIFKYSCPSRKTGSKKNIHFEALPMERLTDSDMTFGMNRELAMANLEAYLLIEITNGNLYWDVDVMGGNFFYTQKTKDEDNIKFVLLRKLIEK